MKKLNIIRAILATLIVWTLGVSAFTGSYFITILDNPDVQANLVLTIALIPASLLGGRFYYASGIETNGVLLGSFMFLVTIFLDASITVPLFIIPAGGNHISFFSDPGFWLIGIEYIIVITVFWFFKKSKRDRKQNLSMT